jgi:hypothetical protein
MHGWQGEPGSHRLQPPALISASSGSTATRCNEAQLNDARPRDVLTYNTQRLRIHLEACRARKTCIKSQQAQFRRRSRLPFGRCGRCGTRTRATANYSESALSVPWVCLVSATNLPLQVCFKAALKAVERCRDCLRNLADYTAETPLPHCTQGLQTAPDGLWRGALAIWPARQTPEIPLC